jgi:threonine dehydratase
MAAATSITLNDVKRAHSAIRQYVTLSPCSVSSSLSARSDCKLHLKMENLQRTGAYKDLLRRGLAKDGRLAKISVTVPDRPASIVDLAAIAASQKANILDIHHGRTFRRPHFAKPRSS